MVEGISSLFRFEKVGDSRLATLGEGKVWLSSPRKFDDLADGQMVMLPLSKSEVAVEKYLKAFDDINSGSDEISPFASFVREKISEWRRSSNEPYTHLLGNPVDLDRELSGYINEHVHVGCFFSGGAESPMMWAHYGDNPQGSPHLA